MPTNWRTLLDSQNIHWVDRGSNHRRNCVVVKCPLCGDADPSEHMLISENNSGWHCHRMPQTHKGSSPLRILHLLLPGTSRQDIVALFNSHTTPGEVVYTPRQRPAQTAIESKWQQFRPAHENRRYLNYLTVERGFPDPEQLCRRYDLRFSPNGKWAARLLIPLYDDDRTIIGWTGRDIRGDLKPKYLTETAVDGPLYLPRPMRATAIIVEGPLDALKIATATEHLPITPIALLGLDLEPLRRYTLNQILNNCDQCYAAFDSTVSFQQYQSLRAGLAFRIKQVYKGRLAIPRPFDDAGEMPLSLITKWVGTVL